MFHINGNLTPTGAVRQYKQLQVHPVIEEWARDSEALGELREKVDDCSEEIANALLSGALLDDVFEALNNGMDMNELYVLLEHKQDVLNAAYGTIYLELDRIYELVNP